MIGHKAINTAISLFLIFTQNTRLTLSEPSQASLLPSGFVDEIVTTIPSLITGFAILPDGRLLVTTKAGILYVANSVDYTPEVALSLTESMPSCTYGERGMLNVVADPNFESNKHIFVYHSQSLNNAPCDGVNMAQNRLVRYTLVGNTAVSPTVLIDNIASPTGFHNGGGLAFGLDGMLYLGTGDGHDAASSQDLSVLGGKVLRIAPDGTIPPSNPYVGAPGSVQCSQFPPSGAGGTCKEIFAYGLRNPFKLTFKPGTHTLYVNDVGAETWEEVNSTSSGDNFGWGIREGYCIRASSTECDQTPAGMKDPIIAYAHADGMCAITGGAFVTGVWPMPYTNNYFFGDWCRNAIFVLASDGIQGLKPTIFYTPSQQNGIVSMAFDIASKSLYYVQSDWTLTQNTIRRIRFSDSANRAPVGVVTASSPNYGGTPFTVTLSSEGSFDPDDDPISLQWDFGDGNPHSALERPQHTYVMSGTYTVTLTVADVNGLTSVPVRTRFYVGNSPPVISIESPLPNAHFSVGQAITFTAAVTDAQDNSLPASNVTWNVLLWHIPSGISTTAHTHPLMAGTGFTLSMPQMPEPEGFDAAPQSFVEVQVRAVDSGGLEHFVTSTLRPQLIPMYVNVEPNGPKFHVNEVEISSTRMLTGWQNMSLEFSTPWKQSNVKDWFKFEKWSFTTAQTVTTKLPSTPITYTAYFTHSLPLDTYLPLASSHNP